jgi:hypothetical protein
LAAAALAVVVAGCTGSPHAAGPAKSAGPSPVAGGSANASVDGGEDPPVAREVTVLPDDTPLAPYRKLFGLPAAGFEARLAESVEVIDQQESLVTSCMNRAGFDYYPVPYAGPRVDEQYEALADNSSMLVVPPLDPDRGKVAKWGYGFDGPPATVEDHFAGQDPEVGEANARNQAYVDSLSASAQEEYWRALYGPDFSTEAGRGQAVKGCKGNAQAQYPYNQRNPYEGDFRVVYADLLAKVMNVTIWDVGMDPRAVALDREWEVCATAKGLDFSPISFVEVHPDGREEYLSLVSMKTRPSPAVAMDMARGLDANGEPGVTGADWLLRGYSAQIEVALADYDCRQETHYMDRIMEIQRDVEQRFLDKNREQLEKMRAAAEAQSG